MAGKGGLYERVVLNVFNIKKCDVSHFINIKLVRMVFMADRCHMKLKLIPNTNASRANKNYFGLI